MPPPSKTQPSPRSVRGSEKLIEHVLDLLTKARPRRDQIARARAPEPEMLAWRSPAPAVSMPTIADTNIVGMGISEKVSGNKRVGILALTYYVERKLPRAKLTAETSVPPTVPDWISGGENIVTDVKEIGRLRPEINATRNPFQPGNSIGHFNTTAGTLGAVVTKGGELYILSNSHVLALAGKAKRGDAILYPGKIDGGKLSTDLVAKLAGFKKFIPGTSFVNRVDCAIAKPTTQRLGDLLAEIKGLGLPRKIIQPARGMKVTKVGRTTGRTTGRIEDVHFRFTLDYEGSVGVVGFIDQALCTRYTDDGDSGSLVIEKSSGRAVGLHFAGADGGSVFSPIEEVLKTLKVQLVTKSIKKSPVKKPSKPSPKK